MELMDAECGQSLAPEWLSFNKEPPSSKDKSPTKQTNDRDRNNRRFGKQHSYHHLTHLSPSSSHSFSLSPSSYSNWRHADINPRVLNRSKSSPVFDSKENTESPKSPDRSNNERHFQGMLIRQKTKLKGKPPLLSSRSQPNLLTGDKATWQQPKIRSPPPSRTTSFLGNVAPVPLVSSPLSPSLVPTSITPVEDLDLEMEKFRSLVPSPSVASAATPKPPTRLVSTNRKTPHPKPNGRPEKPATPPPSALQLRKATSEPSLLNNPNAEELRKLKREKSKVALKETLEEADVAVAKRNTFFMDVFKREKQIQESSGEDVDSGASIPLNDAEGRASPSIPLEVHNNDIPSSLPEDVLLARSEISRKPSPPAQLPAVEDEERFLRLLGWRPEEEDHVPELEEAEIAEVRLKINNHQQGMGLALDLSREMTVSIHQD